MRKTRIIRESDSMLFIPEYENKVPSGVKLRIWSGMSIPGEGGIAKFKTLVEALDFIRTWIEKNEGWSMPTEIQEDLF